MRIVFIVLLLALTLASATAQSSRIGYGFFVGGTQRLNRIENSETAPGPVENYHTFGFTTGNNLYYFLNERVSMRGSILVSFESDKVAFGDKTTQEIRKNVATYLSTGFHGVVKTNNKFPFHIVAGISPLYELKNKDQDDLKLKAFDLTGDVGLSYLFSYKGVRISPEIRYAASLLNGMSASNPNAQFIDSFYRDRLSFSLYFY